MNRSKPADRVSRRDRRRLRSYAFWVFVLAVAVRLVVVVAYVQRFDQVEPSPFAKDSFGHRMIKGDTAKYYYGGYVIKGQIASGVSPLVAGPMHVGPFLYPRLIAAYSLATGQIVFNDDGTVPPGQVLGFLSLQAVAFSAVLPVLFLSLARVVPFAVAVGTTVVLAVEPTLVQYSAMMLSETIFIGLVVLAIGLWLRTVDGTSGRATRPTVWHFATGMALALAFLQRPVGAFLPAVFVLATFGSFRWRPSRAFLRATACVCGPLLVAVLAVGLHNQARAGFFFVLSLQQGDAMQYYLANHVLADATGRRLEDVNRELKARDRVFREAAVESSVFGSARSEESVLFEQNQDLKRSAFAIFLDHPWLTIKYALLRSARSANVDPFYPYRMYSDVYEPTDPIEAKIQRDRRAGDVPIRVAYSVLILAPAITGWFLWRSALPLSLHVLATGIIGYFVVTTGWMAAGRYMLPSLSVHALYWAVCLSSLTRVLRSVRD